VTKTVVVTGACGGIGSAVVQLFNERQWRTVGVDRAESETSRSCATFIQGDIADHAQLQAIIRQLTREERVDALINNAAMAMDKEFAEVTVDDWDLTMNTNVRAAFLLTQGLLPQLARAEGGVVNVASVHAVATSRGVAAYAASKGALVALTRAVALDLASSGVRCNAVCPGATNTAMLRAGMAGARSGGDPEANLQRLTARTPLGRVATPAEIAEAILFLADSATSGFVTGQTLTIDGGATSQLSTE
jgi:NAD(P)-dependent dehydrogenase (short-subunit alcohol dehydrogenase family)